MKYIYIILLLTISCNAQKVCRRDIIVVPPDTTVPPPIVYPNLMVVISDADMTDGSGGLNLVTHDGSGKITVTKAGRYMITYSVAGSCDAVDKHIKTGIEINGSGTIVGDGQDHNISNAVDANIPLGSCAILDLAANDTIEISIGTTDTGTPTISVDHLNIVVTMVGGT